MICIPVFGNDEKQITSLLKKIHGLCDIVELRLDLIKGLDSRLLKQIIVQAGLPVIATNRASWEGGGFQGNEDKRIALLEMALECGADFVDIEQATETALKERLFEFAKNLGAQVILSHHDFKKTPSSSQLLALFDNMASQGPHILKIVTHASNSMDFLRLAMLYPKAEEKGKKLIAFCMGRHGCYSRVFCTYLGSFLTFASIEANLSSAPGQIPARIMKEILSRIDSAC